MQQRTLLDGVAVMVSELTDSVAEVLKTFDEGITGVCQGLSKLSDTDATAMWAFTRGEQKIAEMPRIAAIKTLILNHLIHHRGQLSVYLRLLDVPVPSIYGPSADVNPFA